MLYPHDLISCPETLLLCCTVLLNTGDKDADIISSRQPQTHTVTFLETHHHRVRPALWKHGNNSWQRKSLFMTETTKLASCFWVNLSLFVLIELLKQTNKQQLTNTDPYISRSSALGFSGTLGGAWTFGVTLAAGTAETKSFTVSIQFNCLIWLIFYSLVYSGRNHVYLVVSRSVAPPSLRAKQPSLQRLCRHLWMGSAWHPFLPAC